MKRAILIIVILLTPVLNAFSLKDKIIKGARGDYVVTEQAGTYTVLIIRSLTENHLLLEEIDVPTFDHDPKTISWKDWIAQEAPGHTAWVSYLIDLDKNKLVESYSHSRNAWLYADDPNHFLARLLTLSLERTPQDKRKRIGTLSSHSENDHRALWTPSVIFEGKKIEKPAVTAWSAKWPSDGSIIAECEVELYFSQFPFPCWIEIKSPHYKAALRTLDSGNNMDSPKPIVFQQSPFFIGGNQWKLSGFDLHLHAPKYYPNLRLLVMDISQKGHPLIDITETASTGEITLHVPESTLEAKLQHGHQYRWVIVSKEYPDMIVYSDTTFQW